MLLIHTISMKGRLVRMQFLAASDIQCQIDSLHVWPLLLLVLEQIAASWTLLPAFVAKRAKMFSGIRLLMVWCSFFSNQWPNRFGQLRRLCYAQVKNVHQMQFSQCACTVEVAERMSAKLDDVTRLTNISYFFLEQNFHESCESHFLLLCFDS